MRISKQRFRAIFTILLVYFPPSASARGFERDVCQAKLGEALNQAGVFWVRIQLFHSPEQQVNISGVVLKREYFLNEDGINATNTVLTPAGCQALCSRSSRWYKDIGARMMTWLLPVVLLIANMEVSAVDRWRYSEIFNVIGNPIGSLLSLLSRAESWTACYYLDVREHNIIADLKVWELGTILTAIEDLVGSATNPLDDLLEVVSWASPEGVSELVLQVLKSTAFTIAESRTNDIIRTAFSVALYFLQLIAAFVTTLGGGVKGNSSPPGGRIAIAMLLTWLIPTVLLSNTIGGFNTRRVCFRTLSTMLNDLKKLKRENKNNQSEEAQEENEDDTSQTKNSRNNSFRSRLQDREDYFRNQRWMGGSELYRPHKTIMFGKIQPRRQYVMFALATAPIIVSSITGGVIMWYTPPVGLSCRSVMLISITLAWLLSPFINWVTQATGIVRGRNHWIFVLVKDIFFSVSIMLLVFLSSSGLFNTCACQGAQLSLKERACIPLNWLTEYGKMNARTYPAVSTVCVVLQVLLFLFMLFFERKGLQLIRWKESERQAQFLKEETAYMSCKPEL